MNKQTIIAYLLIMSPFLIVCGALGLVFVIQHIEQIIEEWKDNK